MLIFFFLGPRNSLSQGDILESGVFPKGRNLALSRSLPVVMTTASMLCAEVAWKALRLVQ